MNNELFDFLVNKIKSHAKFEFLNMIQQNRIISLNHLVWLKTCLKCYKIDPERTINEMMNEYPIDNDFRIIYADVLKSFY